MLQVLSMETTGARGDRTLEEEDGWCWWKTEGHPGEPLLLDRESPMSCGTVCSGLLIASRLLCDKLWCSMCDTDMSCGPTERLSLFDGIGNESPWSISMSNFRLTGNWLGLSVMGL